MSFRSYSVIIRNVIAGLAPRAQSDHSFIERTSGIMRRMDSTRTIELNRLAEEEKRTCRTRHSRKFASSLASGLHLRGH